MEKKSYFVKGVFVLLLFEICVFFGVKLIDLCFKLRGGLWVNFDNDLVWVEELFYVFFVCYILVLLVSVCYLKNKI